MENEDEIWKDIAGYEGFYQISNYGRIKSLERMVRGKRTGAVLVKEKIKHISIKKQTGYARGTLLVEGNRKEILVHQLVWDAFGDGRKNSSKNNIDHIDTNKLNNHISNLQLLSAGDHKAKTYQDNGKVTPTNISYSSTERGRKKFKVQMRIDGKNKSFGRFLTLQDAINAKQQLLERN